MKWCLAPLLALALTFGAAPGCAPPRPADQALVAHGFDGAALAVVALDAVQGARLAAMQHPTREEAQAEAERVGRLRRARDALAMARASFGRDDAHMRERALVAVSLLEMVATDLTEAGSPVPHEVHRALAIARAWLELPP